MCTVTYLPTHAGFILTSNRDEALARKQAENPHMEKIEGKKILFPRDGEAHGTWIATTENNRTVCLLNGAFIRHHHAPPYRMSRGLVVLDFFKTESAHNFHQNYNLQGIEPFTMVIVENHELFEFRWNGTEKFFKPLDAQKPHIYCSATLYTPEVIAMRQRWFAKWLIAHPEYCVEDILTFHLFAGEGDEQTQVRMSIYGIVQTVSITSITSFKGEQTMYYSDLKGEKSFSFNGYGFSNSPDASQPKGINIPANFA